MHHGRLGGFEGRESSFGKRVLATAGMIEGYEVSCFLPHGPEMRGGRQPVVR